MLLFQKHQARLEQAIKASHTREYFKSVQESPASRFHPEGAKQNAEIKFKQQLGKPFELSQPGEKGRIGQECSPYTLQPLGIDYPDCDLNTLFSAAAHAMPTWREAGPQKRIGVCLEILSRLEAHLFENTYATMHTTGQPFLMAFAGNGAAALERGLEAITYAYKAMNDFPQKADCTGHFEGESVTLHKTYKIHPVGIAVVMACGSYPAWNALPAIFASLACGNPVMVKPHPGTILPVALQVQHFRKILTEQGFDPNLVCLVPENAGEPIALELLNHPQTAIVDFTGSSQFGALIETKYRHLQVYTETSGCNSVVLESTNDLERVLAAVANSLCLFSAQMCTAPQNIFIPAQGVRVQGKLLSYETIVQGLLDAVEQIVSNPQTASAICGAIHSPNILAAIKDLTQHAEREERVLRYSTTYPHPSFPKARTATPLLVEVALKNRALFQKERFGPMSFVIRTESATQALQIATEDAKQHGAIASFLYSENEAFLRQAEAAYALAGASVGINLIHHRPLNVAAAFSDFHVSGMNPAGNASLTDLAFVARRFRVTQIKREGGHAH